MPDASFFKRRKLHPTMKALCSRGQILPFGFGEPYYYLASGVIDHDIYHIGQIVLHKKKNDNGRSKLKNMLD
ncbi:MAG: hypothetical protein ACI9FN_003398 [Saprospiraceae bacterium]|jgi:hypothetical protein